LERVLQWGLSAAGGLPSERCEQLRQMPYIAPRTWNGMASFNQTKTVGLCGGAFGGGTVGFGGDLPQSRLGW